MTLKFSNSLSVKPLLVNVQTGEVLPKSRPSPNCSTPSFHVKMCILCMQTNKKKTSNMICYYAAWGLFWSTILNEM